MGEELSYSLAFMAGILGSGHCVGMCGSLVSACFVRMGEAGKGILPVMAYHGARVSIYVLVGLLAATLGLALVSTGIIGKVQGILQIVAGLVVIALGLDILGWLPRRLPLIGMPMRSFGKYYFAASAKGPVRGAALAGLMNGLMPCALTLAVAVKASTAPDIWQGGMLMLAFGLGTLPSMLFVSLVLAKLGAKARGWLLKGAAVVVIALGAATLMQGLRFFMVMKNLANW
ncbi:sulfite exporter TauE/SafE family protein [Paramagnetospirillum kuznetsovii]|uniref:Sulfite exporter TauE/SafE family protein n=1 Tax=Paramagnetospirillum kuznetsovii TaxID=2053833 RepID=A0A364NTB8_9PROT|nr:sulfite exporter TauE/SafE family protein [Paramagnetospirillum kuznetsovii]RAU20331.1 sulfite exporter TauE/SafE family protein [Paramagnetospirillum kuznetsovii]